jgi:hypothetical protein
MPGQPKSRMKALHHGSSAWSPLLMARPYDASWINHTPGGGAGHTISTFELPEGGAWWTSWMEPRATWWILLTFR